MCGAPPTCTNPTRVSRIRSLCDARAEATMRRTGRSDDRDATHVIHANASRATHARRVRQRLAQAAPLARRRLAREASLSLSLSILNVRTQDGPPGAYPAMPDSPQLLMYGPKKSDTSAGYPAMPDSPRGVSRRVRHRLEPALAGCRLEAAATVVRCLAAARGPPRRPSPRRGRYAAGQTGPDTLLGDTGDTGGTGFAAGWFRCRVVSRVEAHNVHRGSECPQRVAEQGIRPAGQRVPDAGSFSARGG